DASGAKIKKEVNDGTQINTTAYQDGFQYSNNSLEFFPTAEGYVKTTRQSRSGYDFNYVFNHTDHLGNIRVRYTQHPVTGDLEILQQDHYYPFGLKHEGYNNEHFVFSLESNDGITLVPATLTAEDGYKYKFGGKEYQDEFDVNVYDFGARNYDAALGRWMNVDALSDFYLDWSTYNYALNNPVFYIDPDGNYVDVSNIYKKNDNDEYENANLVEAFEFFASTDFGKSFLSNYAEKGQVIAGQEYKKDGKFHSKNIDISFGQLSEGDNAEGRTAIEKSEDGLKITINLREKSETSAYIETIGHEGFIHADKYSTDYSHDKQINFSAGIDPDIVEYVKSQTNNKKYQERWNHHFQERRDKILEKKLIPILRKYYESKGVIKSLEDLKKDVGYVD